MNNSEDIIKKLIKSTEPDKPSGDFKYNVMQKIRSEPAYEKSPESKSILSTKYIIMLGFALFATVAVILFIDLSFMNRLLGDISFASVTGFVMKFFSSIRQTFHGIELSTVSIVVIVGLLGLIFLDKFLRKALKINLTII